MTLTESKVQRMVDDFIKSEKSASTMLTERKFEMKDVAVIYAVAGVGGIKIPGFDKIKIRSGEEPYDPETGEVADVFAMTFEGDLHDIAKEVDRINALLRKGRKVHWFKYAVHDVDRDKTIQMYDGHQKPSVMGLDIGDSKELISNAMLTSWGVL